MSINIGLGKKPMQGPCPDGFHIPTNDEFTTVLNYLGENFGGGVASDLKLPAAGKLNYNSGTVSGNTGERYYWTSDRSDRTNGYRRFSVYDSQSSQVTGQGYIGYGGNIRPFKDVYVPNTGDGWTNLYKQVYWNASLGLITIPPLQITLADKNIGATEVGAGRYASQNSYGYYYQWGNNYGFTSGQVTTSSTAVSASGYGPGNYYSSSTFITQAARDTSENLDLWGAVSAGGVSPEISSVYIGTVEAAEVYVGDIKIWPTTPPVVPVDICFSYTGAAQCWTVPATQEYCIEVWGAQGGNSPSANYVGGYGGYAAGKICLQEGCKLCIYVGGHPATCSTRGGYTCGWNGGGCGRVGCYSKAWVYAQGGGGGTDVRYNGNTLCHRFIVAGGGAGGACGCCQSINMATIGAGGGECGCSPAGANWVGKQNAAGCRGSFGQGADGGTDCDYKNHAGGGGGGWYGGGATNCRCDTNKTYQCCAGGGSGYTYTASTCGNHPNKACLGDLPLMTDAVCCPGSGTIPTPSGGTQTGWQGNGCVKITNV